MNKGNKGQNNKQQDKMQIENKTYKYDLINLCVTVPFLVLIAACGVLLVLYSTSKYGSAITHDSVAYIYAAESILSGKGMQYFGYDSPLVQWPPLFPLILAGMKSAGVNLIFASAHFNGIIYALVILISGLWILKNTRNGIFAIIGSLALLASIPLYYVSRFIWSETLFIFFTLLFFISMDNYIEKTYTKVPLQKKTSEESSTEKSSIKFLILASIFAALACLTRYIGITVVITGAMVLLIQKKKVFNRLLEIVLFGAISSVPTVIWVVRNYLLTGTLTGGRFPSQNGINENIELFFKTISLWIAPTYSENMAYLIIGIFIFIAIIIILICKINLTSQVSISASNNVNANNNVNKIIILLIFSIIYSVYLLLSASTVSFDSINNRLLSPIYIALILLMLFTIAAFIDIASKGKVNMILITILAALLFSSWIVYPLSEIRDDANYSYENGAGILSSKWWEQSPLIEYVRELPSDFVICSNCPDAVYIHSGKISRYPPKKEGLHWYGIRQFEKIVEENENVYIIWFDVDVGESIYNIQELQEYFRIEVIDKLYDGIIYSVHQ